MDCLQKISGSPMEHDYFLFTNMQSTDLAIIILTLLSISILILSNHFDRKFYRITFFNQLPASGSFFNNSSYEEPVNRFLLSKGGLLLSTLVLLTEITVGIIIEHAA